MKILNVQKEGETMKDETTQGLSLLQGMFINVNEALEGVGEIPIAVLVEALPDLGRLLTEAATATDIVITLVQNNENS